jgi:hypothetical protein
MLFRKQSWYSIIEKADFSAFFLTINDYYAGWYG